jgi:hypothetical protein
LYVNNLQRPPIPNVAKSSGEKDKGKAASYAVATLTASLTSSLCALLPLPTL